jgi:hypothetical protein
MGDSKVGKNKLNWGKNEIMQLASLHFPIFGKCTNTSFLKRYRISASNLAYIGLRSVDPAEK